MSEVSRVASEVNRNVARHDQVIIPGEEARRGVVIQCGWMKEVADMFDDMEPSDEEEDEEEHHGHSHAHGGHGHSHAHGHGHGDGPAQPKNQVRPLRSILSFFSHGRAYFCGRCPSRSLGAEFGSRALPVPHCPPSLLLPRILS